MAHRLIRLKRPEDESEEARLIYGVQHKCAPAHEIWMRTGEVADALIFPVGLFGRGMPTGVPFEVATTEPCDACGTILRAWFEWTGGKVIDLGAMAS